MLLIFNLLQSGYYTTEPVASRYDAATMGMFVLIIVIGVIGYIVQARLQHVFKKYSEVPFPGGLTGAEVAEKMLRDNKIHNVKITHVSGQLTDHFNPQTMTVNLSDAVYSSTSVAAAAVAAHECGHAVQHNTDYVPLKVRSAIVPAANLGSQLFWPLFLIGLIFSLPMLVKAGIWLFVLALAFQVVTLPVEFDASRRALKMLSEGGMVTETEHDGVKKVLWAAAMTYVAAVIGSLLQLLRLLILSGAFRRNDD